MTQTLSAIRSFAHTHDELPAFHAAYVVLTFTLAILLNLGAFAVLIGLHMALDVWKYREYHQLSWRDTVEGTVRESVMDVTLLMVGFVFSVYLHHSVGVGSVSTLLRAEFGLLRSVALFIPKVKILHHILKVVSHLHHYLRQVHPHMHAGWSRLDRFCFAVIALSVCLLLFAAPLMQVDASVVGSVLLSELLPWRL